jgi:hypothetical protein
MPPVMRILLSIIGLSLVAVLGCNLVHAEEPKQRQEWSAPPMKYGNTQWEGLQAPGADAGRE